MPPALEAWGFITAREVLGPFFLEERYHNLSNSATGNRERTSYPGLKNKPLTLCKVGRFKTSIYFFQHQHLIPDLTGTETYKRFTLFLWMCTLFTIQFIKYLPFYQPTAPCSALTTLLLLKADQIGGWHLSRKWMEWTAGREPYFMHLSEHIAIKGVESLSEGTGEGCGSSLPSHLYPPALKQSCLCQVQLSHLFKTHLQNSYCEQGVLGRWMRGKYIPMHFLWKTSPMIKNHSKNT